MTVYQIGKSYSVPCVYARYGRLVRWWPVLGPAHEDAELINFPHFHYHVDVRFVDQRSFDSMRKYCETGINTSRHPQFFSRSLPIQLHPGNVECEFGQQGDRFYKGHEPKPVMKRRKCLRDSDPYTLSEKKPPWTTCLEKEFQNTKLVRGHCPHRAADLSTMKPDALGCVECPLHGLVWHVESGNMVPRDTWEKARANQTNSQRAIA